MTSIYYPSTDKIEWWNSHFTASWSQAYSVCYVSTHDPSTPSSCSADSCVASSAFIHWHNESKWTCHDKAKETDLKVSDSDDPATVANAILEIRTMES